ncbi:cysteine desulfurase family protein [Candidatus Merdisoma sp. JLR.KK006]|uniref:cysteine desulfurase family protein n=1 Tax=Candidatus Merdisoma sp. JLR.KK006 TaxID=3112626 RepID=UPI002FEF0E3D
MKEYIYADNAATTKLDMDAFEAMKPYLLEEYGNVSQPYSFSRSGKRALKDARETIARCINAEPEEIFFTSGGTESDNWALKGVAFKNKFIGNIVTSEIEHHAILNTCKILNDAGMIIKYLAVTKNAQVEVKELKENLDSDTKLVTIMFANNEVGSIQQIRELAEAAHNRDVLFHTDAVQAVGHVKIDVKDLNVDMLSASAHKFNGPKGIGFFYKKNKVQIAPYMNGGAQEKGLRAGTENIAFIVAMAYALKKNCEELEQNEKHLFHLEKVLEHGLRENNIVYRRNGAEVHIPGNVNLSFPGYEGEVLLHRLDLMGISVSTGSACDSVNTQISHVLQAMKLDEALARGTIRISFGKNNTVEDVKKIVFALTKILN